MDLALKIDSYQDLVLEMQLGSPQCKNKLKKIREEPHCFQKQIIYNGYRLIV